MSPRLCLQRLSTKLLAMLIATCACGIALVQAKTIELLNVSYDPTRELYEDYNKAFGEYWLKKTGDVVTVKQSHGGSGKQARSVIDGLKADVATLAVSLDIDAIASNANALPANWAKQLPYKSAPYTSTIVLLVRKGNPKNIKDWSDLIKPGVSVLTPNPKTGGGARWNYLAAWSWALKQPGGTDASAQAFVQKLYKNVPVMDSGARGSATTFIQRGMGDVLVSWENEAFLAIKEFGPDKLEMIIPSVSILAEPSVAVIRKVAAAKGNSEVANAYLQYLFSGVGQDIIGRNFYRPRDAKALAKYDKIFVKVPSLATIEDFGGWPAAQARHFDDGGIFDKMTAP